MNKEKALSVFLVVFTTLLLVTPLAAANKIYPEYLCWEEGADGGYKTHWRYINLRGEGYEIPLGPENEFMGGGRKGPDMGQPTVFSTRGLPGEEFVVESDGTKLVWSLDGKTVAGGVVSRHEHRCPGLGEHEAPEFGGLAALVVVSLAAVGLVFLKRRRKR